MKRAALIIVEGDYASVTEEWFEDGRVTATSGYSIDPSEQLLADLQTLVAPWNASVDVLVAARANVRSLLPRR